jgi:hypothetical protein
MPLDFTGGLGPQTTNASDAIGGVIHRIAETSAIIKSGDPATKRAARATKIHL